MSEIPCDEGQRIGAMVDKQELPSAERQDNSSAQCAEQRLDDMISLLRELDPFLAGTGVAYCRIKGYDQSSSSLCEIRHQITKDFLAYRYRKVKRKSPPRGVVDMAISIVHGELWSEQLPPVHGLHCVTRLILTIAKVRASWAGSATELLEMVKDAKQQDAEQQDAILDKKESLPENEDALGICLRKIMLELESQGIRLYRPPRRDKSGCGLGSVWC